MHTLFRMPVPQRITTTPDQIALLDLIALRDGEPLGPIHQGARATLRRLLAKKLIEVVTLGPAIYVLTPVGRMVRNR